jgi:hypothetical protein
MPDSRVLHPEVENDMTMSSADVPRQFPGRLLLVLGPVLAVLGVIGYAVQMSLQRLAAPWYMPGLATLGVVLVVLSLRERRTFWRMLALAVVVLMAGAEWAFMFAMRQPSYTGPVKAGQTIPAFATTLSDGTTFTQNDLKGDQNTVLVFFRGRW